MTIRKDIPSKTVPAAPSTLPVQWKRLSFSGKAVIPGQFAIYMNVDLWLKLGNGVP